jgi:hypothetical protein
MKRFAILAGLAAAAAAGSVAFALARDNTHTMTVALPDGSTARIEYAGDTPPKVTIEPLPFHDDLGPAWSFPWHAAVADFDRIWAAMDREIARLNALARRAGPRAVAGLGARTGVAGEPPGIAPGSLPPGSWSYSFVSTTRDGRTCNRWTEVKRPADGGKPRVVTRSSGDCAPGGDERPAPDNSDEQSL